MVKKRDFDIGDLVWAKMKSFPYWPAEIVEPPTNAKSTFKKGRHYVFFFGSKNFAWIQDENIVHHSEEMLQSCSKKKSNLLKLAIKQITEEAHQMAKSVVKEIESPEVLTNCIKKKINEVQRMEMNSESLKVRKKIVPKRRLSDHHPTTTNTSLRITSHDNLEFQPGPTRSLSGNNEAIRVKKITTLDKNIGFIGLGMMGQTLVKKLLNKHKVTVWNRSIEKSVNVSKFGAKLALTPSDVVRRSDIIFCCVSGPQASKSVVFGKHGILSGFERSQPGSKGYVEMTTMDPTTSREISEALTHKGGSYLEATLNGSLQMAEEGELLLVCSGDSKLFLNCASCFSPIANCAYLLPSEVGSGSMMSIIHSMLIGISHAALAESMALIKRCNLSQVSFLDILNLGPINSRLMAEKGLAILYDSFENTSLKHQQKALSLALSLDSNGKQPLLLTAAANELFKRAKYHNCSDVYDIYNDTRY